jgi:hypothetical protein
MKYKLKKGLRHLPERYTGLSSLKYNDLIEGKYVLLNKKEVEKLDSIGVTFELTEKKKKEEKIENG